MKKKEGAKKASATARRAGAAATRAAIKKVLAPAKPQPSSPRTGGDGIGAEVPASVIHQLEKRLEHNARQFEDAKKRFEKTARARVSTQQASQQHQIQKDLTEFGLEMRLLTARRSELLWVQQLFGPAKN